MTCVDFFFAQKISIPIPVLTTRKWRRERERKLKDGCDGIAYIFHVFIIESEKSKGGANERGEVKNGAIGGNTNTYKTKKPV